MIKKASIFVLSFFPLLAFAFPTDLRGAVDFVLEYINILVYILSLLTFLVFVWGLTMFIFNADSATNNKKGKDLMIWGIVGLFIMLSVWGIIEFAKSQFGFGGGTVVPQLPDGRD